MDLSGLSKEQLAETFRSLQKEPPSEPLAEVDQLKLVVHDLHVHRCELEMQNRALREMQGELEHSIQRYADSYDHLPLAYVTLTPQGRILGANQLAEEWLERERRGLIGGYLGRFFDAYDAGRLAGD